MALLEIEIISYPPEAENLINIWRRHTGFRISGIDVIKFTHKYTGKAKGDNRRIAGLKAECISYLKNDIEMVKMSVEDFIKLMAKVGVEMRVKRVKEKEEGC